MCCCMHILMLSTLPEAVVSVELWSQSVWCLEAQTGEQHLVPWQETRVMVAHTWQQDGLSDFRAKERPHASIWLVCH